MESLDSPPPSSQIEWMYIHKLTEATVASCVVVESSILYIKVYYSMCNPEEVGHASFLVREHSIAAIARLYRP